MKRWQKWVAGCAVFLLVLAGFVALILPGIVRSQAIKQVEAATGRKFSIGKVSLNPFTWTAEVRNVRLSEKDGRATFVSFSSVRATVSPSSIWRAAPVISNAHITAPYFHLVRIAANTYNFSDLMEPKGPKKEKTGNPPCFSLNNIVISNGSVDFLDRGLPVEKSHTVRRIEVGIPFISNIPYLADKYVLPSLSAVVNGSPLHAEGKMKPFARAHEVSLEIELKDLDLPFYFAYLPGPVPISIDSGQLSITAGATYRISQDDKPELNIAGKIALADLYLRDRTGEPLVALKKGFLGISKAGILAREFAFSTLSAEGLETFLSRDRKGAWSFDRLLGKGVQPKPDSEKKKEPPERKPLVSIAEIRLRDGKFHFADALPAGGFNTTCRDITLDVKGFSTAEGKKASYSLTFATDRQEMGKLGGDFSVTPMSTATVVDFGGIVLEAYYPYLADLLTAPVKGRIDATAGISMTPSGGVKVEKGTVQLKQLSVAFGKDEGVKLPLAEIKVASISLKDKSADVESVSFTGLALRMSRDKEGKLSPLAMLREKGKGKPKKEKEKGSAGKIKKAQQEKASPFRYLVRNITGNGFAVAFTDRMKEEEPRLEVKKLSFSLSNVTGPKFAPIPFRLAAAYGKNGEIKTSGTVTPAPFRVKGGCAVRRIPLTDFDAYLPEDLNIILADGSLDTKVSFNLAKGKGGLAGDFKGELGVRNFYCLDEEHEEDLLKWESLQMDGISGSLAPFSLAIKDVSLNNYFAKVVVNKDGALNLQQLRKPAKEKAGVEKTALSPPPPSVLALATPSGQPPAPQPKSVRIDTITFQDGVLAFTDHHMSPEFATTMYNLGGRVSGLTSEEGKFADIDLRGNLENQSPLKISGKINPLRDNLFLDLDLKFSDIELSPMTPYSGTFLGYLIDKGKLFLDLKYHIENKKLDSTNKVFLDQFTFGKKVESKKATSLPVRLAVALLKDRKGEIHLDLPVTGRTDDPKFSVWGVVLQILKNLLVKAATSPFALLQSAFGGKDDFSAIQFAAGSSRLSEVEKGKVRKLAQAINDRPSLKIEVSGFVDRERDPEGYRNELLMKKMKNEKFLALVKEKKGLEGENADSVTILPAEYPLYLKAVYKKEKFPKPRNIVGMVKDIPDAEMKKLILANTVVGEENLKSLARERATAVRTALVVEGKFPPERIFEKSSNIYKPPAKEGETGSRVEFGVAAE